MATKKRRRALTADEQALTPADRAAIRLSRANTQSSRYQREVAIEKAHAAARPTDQRK
ncbi:hypothetical protein IFT74_15525 [Oxalobacteraceae sp. CFBP 8755]|nr:hypothetical protein [Oxalobacteraceae sp. CFBP 8755]